MPLPKHLLAKGHKKPKREPAEKSKKRRGPRGLGSTWQDDDGTWRSKVPVGRYPNGSTKYTWLSGPTEKSVIDQRKALKPPTADVTVREWAERWFKSLAIGGSSKHDYRNTLDVYILPTFGDRRLAGLTAHDVEAAAQRWSKAGGGALGANTLRKNLGQLRACLSAARRAKLIPDNPVTDARKPKAKKVRIDPFTPAELSAIVDRCGARPLDAIVALLATVGLRIGEALALDVGDYDPGTGTVSITKTYCRRHGVRAPKSENGFRTLEVPLDARAAVELAHGGRRAGPLFAAEGTGGRRQHNTVYPQWEGLLRDLGLRKRNPHQLRHSVATAWIAAGVGVGDVARDLGDSVQTVVKTYIHPTGLNTARVMERILEGGRKVARPAAGASAGPGNVASEAAA